MQYATALAGPRAHGATSACVRHYRVRFAADTAADFDGLKAAATERLREGPFDQPLKPSLEPLQSHCGDATGAGFGAGGAGLGRPEQGARLLGGFEGAGLIHRLCAFVMIVVFVTHVAMVFTRAIADLRSFSIGFAAAFLVVRRTTAASSTSMPRMRSTTSRTRR